MLNANLPAGPKNGVRGLWRVREDESLGLVGVGWGMSYSLRLHVTWTRAACTVWLVAKVMAKMLSMATGVRGSSGFCQQNREPW
jgi:hypothetical protein